MEHKDVPFIVLESAEARHERIEKRLIIALVMVIIMMFATNALWLYHESQITHNENRKAMLWCFRSEKP